MRSGTAWLNSAGVLLRYCLGFQLEGSVISPRPYVCSVGRTWAPKSHPTGGGFLEAGLQSRLCWPILVSLEGSGCKRRGVV